MLSAASSIISAATGPVRSSSPSPRPRGRRSSCVAGQCGSGRGRKLRGPQSADHGGGPQQQPQPTPAVERPIRHSTDQEAHRPPVVHLSEPDQVLLRRQGAGRGRRCVYRTPSSPPALPPQPPAQTAADCADARPPAAAPWPPDWSAGTAPECAGSRCGRSASRKGPPAASTTALSSACNTKNCSVLTPAVLRTSRATGAKNTSPLHSAVRSSGSICNFFVFIRFPGSYRPGHTSL